MTVAFPKSIETISEPIVALLRRKTSAERIILASNMHRFARTAVTSVLRHRHPDWTDEQIHKELMRRLLGGTS